MPHEKSAGAIIFHQNKNTEYLLLHYPSGSRPPKDYWDFPKGHIEKGEKEEETAIREVKEETGIEDIEFISGFRELITYFYKLRGGTIFKTVVFYLAKTKEQNAKLSSEHIGYAWLPYGAAFDRLTFDNAKQILKNAHTFLAEKHKTKP